MGGWHRHSSHWKWLQGHVLRPNEGEELGLVGLDGMEEGVVVGGAGGGNFAQQEIDVTRGGDGLASSGVLGAEGSVIAVDGRTRGDLCGGARWKMKGNAGLHFERSAQFDGRSSSAGGGFGGRIGQA